MKKEEPKIEIEYGEENLKEILIEIIKEEYIKNITMNDE